MKKAIGQTVRDLKREVNKKVLKVPGIEQKVLDATSNEPWGPHGSLLADIAQATRNYHEYQMIMAVVWKRINDTGKNWRHVYKALTVLEYLVAHGSERVIDEIREHAYQISTLADFQYIDSSGKDQGNNVRRKSQSLVLLVNDKEKIIEARQKAAANRDKFRNTSAGGMYRPGSYSGSGGYGDRYDGDRYGGRDDDRYGYGREKEYGYREDDRYGRDGDRYSRDNEDRYGRDGYRDDEYRGRSPGADDYQRGSRSRSADMDRNYDDDGQHSSRGSSVKAEDRSLEARLERKLSEQNASAPPSYEEAVSESRSPMHSERDVEASTASAPKGSSPHVNGNIAQNSAPTGSSPQASDNPAPATDATGVTPSARQEAESFDEFDPRGPLSAAPVASNNVEVDLLGSLTESFSSNALALVPTTSAISTPEVFASDGSTAPFAAAASGSTNINQPFEDPFGDSPFKAIPTSETAPNQPQTYQSFEPSQSGGLNSENASNFGYGDSFSAAPHSAPGATHTQPFSSSPQLPQDLSASQQETDILADILPPAPLPVMTSHPNLSTAASQPSPPSFLSSTGQSARESFSVPSTQLAQQGFSAANNQPGHQAFSAPSGHFGQQPFSAPTSQPVQSPFSAPTSQAGQSPYQTFSAHPGQPVQHAFSSPSDHSMQPPFSAPGGQMPQPNGNLHGGFNSQVGSLTPQPPTISQPQNSHNGHLSTESFLPQGSTAPIPPLMPSQTPAGQDSRSANFFPQQGGSSSQSSFGPASQYNSGSVVSQQGNTAPFVSSITHQSQSVPGGKQNDVLSSLFGPTGGNAPNASSYTVSSSGQNAIVPVQSKEKFETKSTVWADTLSRGLVNLNISGPKINPLSDIGIDFDAINRKEKRMEKPTTTTTSVTSTVTMGKAMGSGSGIGRAGAGALRAPPNPMMGSGAGMGMNMGMGNGPGMGMGMGGYGGMNPSMGMGMGMNLGMGQGPQMQGMGMNMPPGANMPGNYNPMMGPGGYPQQPYGGGYR